MASQINASNSGFGGIVSTGDSSGVLQLQTTGTTAVTIDTSQRAAFVAGTAALPAITTTGDTNTGMFFPSADTIAFAEGGAEVMRINSSGNVGIGTTSPSNKLDIFNSNFGGTNTSLILSSVNSAAAKINYAGLGYECSQGSAGIEGGAMLFSTYGSGALSERMRIDSSGNLLVGTTSVLGSAKATFAASTATTVVSVKAGNNGNAGIEFYNTSSASQGYIVINASSVQYLSVSDYRLKENVVPMTGALDKVALLKPVTYTWKIDGSDGQGFIAHELAEVVPDCVSGEKDAVDEEGNIKPQGIDTSFLVATLTAAIQEQQTIINDLKARVTALETK